MCCLEQLDESLPTVSVQIQLHNNTKKVAKFNLTHTVLDLQLFVARCVFPSSLLRISLV